MQRRDILDFIRLCQPYADKRLCRQKITDPDKGYNTYVSSPKSPVARMIQSIQLPLDIWLLFQCYSEKRHTEKNIQTRENWPCSKISRMSLHARAQLQACSHAHKWHTSYFYTSSDLGRQETCRSETIHTILNWPCKEITRMSHLARADLPTCSTVHKWHVIFP